LDYLVIEKDINILILMGHVEIVDVEDDDLTAYIPNQFAVDFFKEKYDVDLDINKPFDFNLFYERPDKDDPIMDLINSICLN
jgi:hypothetical protein